MWSSASKYLGLDRISGVYLWLLFLVVFGAWRPTQFLTSVTLHSVASSQAVAGIVAIAVLIPLVCGHYDLSVGANANLAGIIAVVVQEKWHVGVPAAIIFAVAVGSAVGVVNGAFVVRFHVNSFIVTLGMASVLSATQVIVTAQQQPNPISATSWNNFSQYSIGGFQIVVLYLIVLGLAAYWFLDHTPMGRYMRAIGANPDAARLSGVRVDRWSFLSLVMSGGIAALGGVLYTSLTGPSLSFGATLLLPAFAAAFLGSTQLQPGRFNVWGTLLAIYVLATGVVGMQLISGQQWLSDMFNGIALILAVALAVNRQRRVASRGGGTKDKTAVQSDEDAYDTEPAIELEDQTARTLLPSGDRERAHDDD
jgi:ribose transport system permease protein